MPRKLTVYVIADLNGTVRTLKTRPSPNPTEVVVKLDMTMPTPPKIAAHLQIDLPEPPDAKVEAAIEQWGPIEEETE
ncbi:MAG: hypothetical protein AAFO29_19425 [Actinomycetota bacterium]